MEDRLAEINNKLKLSNLNMIKKKALELEKESYQFIRPSDDSIKAVSDVLQKADGKIMCTICKASGIDKFLQNEKGLIIHKSRVHNNKKKD
ncbi:unnamed protein product [Brachionus calyciflorus]|uniref:Uncharacterized protein n=1 Tax=Brachionus calyciflorus TaxID=104777 RepID=A0A814GES8_9BILA|nr:unnamed protein product [Brachionus calyciflorus]